MHRCKDTLGNKPGYSWLTTSLPEDDQKKFFDECKYLGVREGDEFTYRVVEKPHPEKRLPLDVRKDFIATEKIWYDTEKELKKILANKDATPESREFAMKGMAMCNLLHPLWIEVGARRRKSGDQSNFLEMPLTENQIV